MEEQFYYRLEDRQYSVTEDYEREIYSTYTDVICHTYRVVKKTAKGAWVVNWGGGRIISSVDPRIEVSFVLDGSGKRKCHSTLELALESFLARKNRAISIMQARIRYAKEAIRIAQNKVLRGAFKVKGMEHE